MRGRSGGSLLRIIFGLVIAGISLFSYLASQEFNEVTGENQYVALTPKQEIALGLQSAPEMIQEFGGLYGDEDVQQLIDNIGHQLVRNTVASDTSWQFEFHVLDDAGTINAFALPGGQIFITTALLNEISREDQIAAILAHEMVHVLARHSSQQIAKSELTNGLVGAVAVAADEAGAAQTTAVIGQLINMKYGRDDEIQSDTLGICLMINSGYDPEAMVEIMEILAAAGGGARPPEFFSTHPSPDRRVERIEQTIASVDEACADLLE